MGWIGIISPTTPKPVNPDPNPQTLNPLGHSSTHDACGAWLHGPMSFTYVGLRCRIALPGCALFCIVSVSLYLAALALLLCYGADMHDTTPRHRGTMGPMSSAVCVSLCGGCVESSDQRSLVLSLESLSHCIAVNLDNCEADNQTRHHEH